MVHGSAFRCGVGFLILAPVVFAAPAADACDCARLKPLTADVKQEASVIFEGTVLEITERSEHTITTTREGGRSSVRPLERTVVFEVTAAWAGVERPRFSVVAEMSDCVFLFQVGEAYVVFANRDAGGQAETNICTRTTARQNANAIVRALGPPAYRPQSAR